LGKFKREEYQILIQERNSNNTHALENINNIATNYEVSAIFMGFQGYKNSSKDGLSKGLSYMLKSISIPTFIIKESTSRSKKERGGFSWVILIEDEDSKSFQAFKSALKFIDPEKDKIKGYSVNYSGGNSTLEKSFNDVCTGVIGQFSIEIIKKDNSLDLTKQLVDIINFGNDDADFVVLGHNPKHQLDVSPSIGIIKSVKSNIFFYSK
jgi:hypothetical protein